MERYSHAGPERKGRLVRLVTPGTYLPPCLTSVPSLTTCLAAGLGTERYTR